MIKVTEEKLVWRAPCGSSEDSELWIRVFKGDQKTAFAAKMSGNGRYMAEFPSAKGWKAGEKPVFSGEADRITVADDQGETLEVAIPGFWTIYAVGYSLVFVR